VPSAASTPSPVADGLSAVVNTPPVVAGSPTSAIAEPTAADGPPPAVSGLSSVVLIGARGANLRRGPGPQYDVVATLRAGARLPLTAVNPTGEWYQVRLPGKGWPWVDAAYATIEGVVDGVPVATAAAPTPKPPAAAPSPTAPAYYSPPGPVAPPTPQPSPTRQPQPAFPPEWLPTATSPPP
jgi:uncharacterized protein YraI